MFFWRKKPCLGSLSQWSPQDLCDRVDVPGVGTTDPDLVDYSERPATPDHHRIEQVLAGRDLSACRLLHVGVGDSGLALRLAGRCRSIDGITVSEPERRLAESLGAPGYRVFVANKYTRELVRVLSPGYQVIIDNNPGSFACCAYHFASMLDNYRWALAPGGELLTDQRGLHWVVEDRRWRMTFDDLTATGQRFGLQAARLTDTVYALKRA
jgi:hypothetical protein